MTGIYYTDVLDVLRDAGCPVRENATTNGWQRRARSSGGFASPPLGVQWHHTASNTSPENDLSYMINGNQDAPVGNLLLDRDGCYWPIAAGAANTAGKGGPLAMSRGSVPQDQANSRTWAIEAANSGTGQAWPTVQIDNYFLGSNALNERFGNLPTDVFNHNTWAPSRKIDPAVATAVLGAWVPGASTSSGTWTQADVTNECLARAAITPEVPDMTDEQAAQLAAVFSILTEAQPGFTAPDGSGATLSPPWASLWGYQLVAANVLPTLGDIQARLAALESR